MKSDAPLSEPSPKLISNPVPSATLAGILFGLALGLSLGTLQGCKTTSKEKIGSSTAAADSDRYVIKAKRTEFYRYGPAQATGPDLVLKKGDEITLIKRFFGFSQIRLPGGTPGYIATDDIQPNPNPPPTPTPDPTLSAAPGDLFPAPDVVSSGTSQPVQSGSATLPPPVRATTPAPVKPQGD